MQVYEPIDYLHLYGEDPVFPQGGGAKMYVATGDSSQSTALPLLALHCVSLAIKPRFNVPSRHSLSHHRYALDAIRDCHWGCYGVSALCCLMPRYKCSGSGADTELWQESRCPKCVYLFPS